MFSVFKKEINSFFSQITGYIIIGIFLTVCGLFIWIIPGEYNIIDSGYASFDSFFLLVPWLYLFLCPAITMNSITAEKSAGTWELLITKPVSAAAIVYSKFLASLVVVLVALLPTLIYYLTVYFVAQPTGNVDSGAFAGSFAGLIFLAGIFLSAGVFASSVSSNPVVAYFVALVISFFMFYGFELFTGLISNGAVADFFNNAGVFAHYKSISRGVIDFVDIAYFLFITVLFLLLTERRIRKI